MAGKILIATVLLVAFGLVGNMDYEESRAAAKHRCDMAKAGYWPEGLCNDGS